MSKQGRSNSKKTDDSKKGNDVYHVTTTDDDFFVLATCEVEAIEVARESRSLGNNEIIQLKHRKALERADHIFDDVYPFVKEDYEIGDEFVNISIDCILQLLDLNEGILSALENPAPNTYDDNLDPHSWDISTNYILEIFSAEGSGFDHMQQYFFLRYPDLLAIWVAEGYDRLQEREMWKGM